MLLDLLTHPFQYVFMQRALVAAVVVGVLCASLGTLVVLRRMSLVGHALTHSALPGLALAYVLGFSIFGGAVVATVLTALLIGFLAKDEAIYEDTSVGIIPTVMFALGILVISSTKSYRDMSAMLFGNILAVTPADLFLTITIAAFTLIVLFLFHKELKLLCVDSDYAKTIGIPLNVLRYGLLLLLALTVVVGIQAVGTILTNALLVIPAAAARLLTNRLNIMILWSCVFAVFSAISGVFVSYYFGLSSGASIVLCCSFCFGLSWLFQKGKRMAVIKMFLLTVFCASFYSLSFAEDMVVSSGKKVKMDYTLTVNNEQVETSVGKEPLEFVDGDHSIIPGLEKGIEGMKVGEEKTVTVEAKDAYGEVDPKAFKEFPKSSMPSTAAPKVGMVLQAQAPDGENFPAVISEIKADKVVLDFNHPLAGKQLTFKVKILDIQNTPPAIPKESAKD